VPKSPEKSHDTATEKTGGKAVDKASPKGSAKDHESGKDDPKGRPAPVNTGNTRVNLAFPFSKIEIQEPSSELMELATLMSELVNALADWVPEETLAGMRTRAEALLTRLST